MRERNDTASSVGVKTGHQVVGHVVLDSHTIDRPCTAVFLSWVAHGDGKTVEVTNTLGTATKTVTTKVGKTGELKRLLTGPVDCEITGITETYDGKALFINVQHPGEGSTSTTSPISSWPYSNTGSGNPATATTAKSARPRSATIVLTRIDGGVIGTDFTLS